MNHRTPKPYTSYDAQFTAKLDAWQFSARGCLDAFGRERFDVLCESDRAFSADGRRIVFLTFENRYAQLGGLAAVMRYLPPALKKAGEDVIMLTPFYINIPSVKAARDKGEFEAVFKELKISWPPPVLTGRGCRDAADAVDADGDRLDGRDDRGQGKSSDPASCKNEMVVSCYRSSDAPVPVYYIGIEGRFTASQNPYSYANGDDLLDDSLAFCAAAPFVLRELGIDSDVLFHAHDWETAPIAVTSKLAVLGGILRGARTALTLHNSFDSGLDAKSKALFFGDGVWGDTVLKCAIPLLGGPLTTVSAPFACELREDPLQRTIFTDHLQGEFAANPPIGIENGMFGRPYLKYTHAALSWARQGDYSKLLGQKARFREKMLEVAKNMDRPEVIGTLARVTDDMPIFFMSGRLDLMQKGFDVIFRALEDIPVEKAGLIFCPSSADAKKHAREIAFFKDIADARPGGVVIWPFRISAEDYATVALGSSFLLMPSFYEPFGAATEGFMNGTPVVARATGGLLAQVRPSGSVKLPRFCEACCDPKAWRDDDATGILYRENDALSGEGWKEILGLPVADRIRVPLYKSMVSEARAALMMAVEVFADDRAYGRMMINGMDSLRGFSWDVAVAKYRRLYDTASRRGFFDV